MTVLRQATRPPGQAPPTLPPGHLSINEVYLTIQGECGWMGTPTVFVRTSHCPLRCVWCDSKYTFTEGVPRRTEDVVRDVSAFPAQHVCLTGGEPLAQPESLPLIRTLAEGGRTVEVETSGSEDIAPINALPPAVRARVTVNLDVKCPGSAMSKLNKWSNLDELRPHDQVKFILADRADYEWARDLVRGRAWACPVWFHGVWKVLDPVQIVEWVKADGLPVRVGIQAHKYLWGDVRGV